MPPRKQPPRSDRSSRSSAIPDRPATIARHVDRETDSRLERDRDYREAIGFDESGQPKYMASASAMRRGGRFFGRGPKGYRRSDERIKEEISDRLMAHPDVDASEIELSVLNGVVTFTGVVADRHQKRVAENIADDVLGVEDVDNRLEIRHGFWGTLTGSWAKREADRLPEDGT